MCQIDNRINNGQTPTDLGQFESFDYDYVYDYILCIGCVHVCVCSLHNRESHVWIYFTNGDTRTHSHQTKLAVHLNAML